jgi:hypothetical protein
MRRCEAKPTKKLRKMKQFRFRSLSERHSKSASNPHVYLCFFLHCDAFGEIPQTAFALASVKNPKKKSSRVLLHSTSLHCLPAYHIYHVSRKICSSPITGNPRVRALFLTKQITQRAQEDAKLEGPTLLGCCVGSCWRFGHGRAVKAFCW